MSASLLTDSEVTQVDQQQQHGNTGIDNIAAELEEERRSRWGEMPAGDADGGIPHPGALRRLRLANFKCLEYIDLPLHHHVNIISCESPGSGKTSILRALQLLFGAQLGDNERVVRQDNDVSLNTRITGVGPAHAKITAEFHNKGYGAYQHDKLGDSFSVVLRLDREGKRLWKLKDAHGVVVSQSSSDDVVDLLRNHFNFFGPEITNVDTRSDARWMRDSCFCTPSELYRSVFGDALPLASAEASKAPALEDTARSRAVLETLPEGHRFSEEVAQQMGQTFASFFQDEREHNRYVGALVIDHEARTLDMSLWFRSRQQESSNDEGNLFSKSAWPGGVRYHVHLALLFALWEQLALADTPIFAFDEPFQRLSSYYGAGEFFESLLLPHLARTIANCHGKGQFIFLCNRIDMDSRVRIDGQQNGGALTDIPIAVLMEKEVTRSNITFHGGRPRFLIKQMGFPIPKAPTTKSSAKK